MSLRTMPMIVLNMGSEMLYILNQRLHAQKIAGAKRQRVLCDVTKTMFAEDFVSALFNDQDIYAAPDVRKIFDRLAHSSIMRLNAKSMSKLYDLMVMGYKRQILSTTEPRELIAILLNHLESIEALIANSTEADLVRQAIVKTKTFYGSLTLEELFLLRATLMDFFQGSKIRISVLLRNNTQLGNGQMIINACGDVPVGTEVPGKVRYFKPGGEQGGVAEVAIANASRHSPPVPSDIFSADRRCKLGLNIYTDGTPSAPAPQSSDPAQTGDQANEQKTNDTPSSNGNNNGGGGGGGGASSPDERSTAAAAAAATTAPSRTQLIQVLDASSSSPLSGSGPGISLTFNDFFASSGAYADSGADAGAGSPAMVMHSGEVAIDHRGKASSTKATLEHKLGLESKSTGDEAKAEAKDGAGEDAEEGDDLLSMMDSAGV